MEQNKYFPMSDVKCKCCGAMPTNDFTEMYDKLTRARTQANSIFIINRWYSCVKHNKAVGGVNNSLHLSAYAVDIRCLNAIERGKFIFSLICNGFNEIVIHKTFIHAGIDKKNPILTVSIENE